MTDLDIIYKIYEEKIYHEPTTLKKTVAQIKNHTIATGLLYDLVAKSKYYELNSDPIYKIIVTDYCFLDAYDSHVEYIKALRKDPRTQLRDFLFRTNCDLAQSDEFISWFRNLNKEELKIVENYCVGHEYYEVIDFILKNRN